MDITLYISIASVVLILFLIWYFTKKINELQKPKEDSTMLEWLKTTQSDMQKLQQALTANMQTSNKNLSDSLQQTTKEINDRLTRAAEVIGELKRETGAFSEIGRSMKSLQEFLSSPKLRGNIGEQVLKDLITQMFPKHSFHLQYCFKSGEKVDAAIQTSAGILPIDSKFPMENFQKMVGAQTEGEKESFRKQFSRDIRKHIQDISKKYILPEEGTMDFALMYIPSEPVFYEVVNDLELLDLAKNNRVYPVSPTTLYAHLQTILLSFEGQKIEQQAKEVFKLLRAIKKDYGKIDENMQVLNKHIVNAHNQMNNVQSSFELMGRKIHTPLSEGEDVKSLPDE